MSRNEVDFARFEGVVGIRRLMWGYVGFGI